MTVLTKGSRVVDTKRGDAGTVLGGDRIARTLRVSWDAGGTSIVWIGRLAATDKPGMDLVGRTEQP